jgi:hypothetical protein
MVHQTTPPRFRAMPIAGIGASHQTGWTALVPKLLQKSGEKDVQFTEALPVDAADCNERDLPT